MVRFHKIPGREGKREGEREKRRKRGKEGEERFYFWVLLWGFKIKPRKEHFYFSVVFIFLVCRDVLREQKKNN